MFLLCITKMLNILWWVFSAYYTLLSNVQYMNTELSVCCTGISYFFSVLFLCSCSLPLLLLLPPTAARLPLRLFGLHCCSFPLAALPLLFLLPQQPFFPCCSFFYFSPSSAATPSLAASPLPVAPLHPAPATQCDAPALLNYCYTAVLPQIRFSGCIRFLPQPGEE